MIIEIIIVICFALFMLALVFLFKLSQFKKTALQSNNACKQRFSPTGPKIFGSIFIIFCGVLGLLFCCVYWVERPVVCSLGGLMCLVAPFLYIFSFVRCFVIFDDDCLTWRGNPFGKVYTAQYSDLLVVESFPEYSNYPDGYRQIYAEFPHPTGEEKIFNPSFRVYERFVDIRPLLVRVLFVQKHGRWPDFYEIKGELHKIWRAKSLGNPGRIEIKSLLKNR